MARLVAVLTDATAIAALVGAVASSNAALADDKVMLGGGAGIALNGGTLCTLTTIGHDGAGAIVGFTSAHCGTTGAAVAAEGTADTLGNVVATDDRLDYAVIKFDPAKVAPIPDFDGFAINGLGPQPGVGEWACKQSRANGHVCFSVRSGRAILGPDIFTAKTPWQPGDDGAPVTVNDLLVGMIRDGSLTLLLVPPTQPEIVSIDAILADVNAKGGIGAGFTPLIP